MMINPTLCRCVSRSLCALGCALVLVTAGSLSGCSGSRGLADPPPEIAERRAMNIFSIQAYYDQMIDDAVLREHTLYTYHFVPHRQELNELGRRNLRVLAEGVRDAEAASINVRRGEESQAVYDARLQAVSDALAQMDVAAERIELRDGFAGGDGVSSNRALLILESDRIRTLGGGGFESRTGPEEIQ